MKKRILELLSGYLQSYMFIALLIVFMLSISPDYGIYNSIIYITNMNKAILIEWIIIYSVGILIARIIINIINKVKK
jgi:hypothetical protein